MQLLRLVEFAHDTREKPGAHMATHRVVVRQSPTDALRFFFDFDPASPGGKGGAGIRLNPGIGLVSIDGVHKNGQLPSRSTGGLIADGIRQSIISKPTVLEGHNVETTTATALSLGGTGQGTLIGNLLDDIVTALGGVVMTWEPIRDGKIWHLRAHVSYP